MIINDRIKKINELIEILKYFNFFIVSKKLVIKTIHKNIKPPKNIPPWKVVAPKKPIKRNARALKDWFARCILSFSS